MNAIANLAATPCADLGECLADLAVDALIDEAELSPKPALVDRRGNGAHADLHLGLMQASALSLWPCFKEMADAAQRHGRIDARLRGVLGQLGRDGEAAMLRTTEGVNTHRGAIWALGLLVAAAALEPRRTQAGEVAARAGRIALLDDPAAAIGDSHGERVRRRYGVGGAREEARLGFPRSAPRPAAAMAQPRRRRWRAERQARCAAGDHERPRRYLRAAPRRPRRPRRDAGWRPRGARRRRQRQSRRASPPVRAGPPPAGAERFARRRRRPAGRLSFPRSPARRVRWVGWESLRWKP